MSLPVQVFGRRDDAARHALRWPAAEKPQGTKSRKVCTGGTAGAMGILPRVGDYVDSKIQKAKAPPGRGRTEPI